jgi:type II secretory pathway pseudopilin PulG
MSLVEILFVVAILGIVAAGAVTLFQPNLADELENAAQIVLADVERARNLAVSNNSKYKLTFNTSASSYYVAHSGTNTSLNTLPSWPYQQRSDTADKQTTLLKSLPGLDDVELVAVVQVVSSTRTRVSELEFTSLGGTVSTPTTEIWLSAGGVSSRRYLAITINPTTGLASVGSLCGAVPTIAN